MEIQTSGKPIESLLEQVLRMNILSSDYFKELFRLRTYHEVIDEIYNQVDHVEPWMTGNCRGPSTAFCLLYKFFTMKLTVKQMQGLLKHPDSPYIRAIGFLYLRYAADPKTLWGWFEPYIKDDEEFSPGSNGKMTTMGVYLRDLLLGQYYFDTLFPRVPVPVLRQITANLEKMKLSAKPSGTIGENSRHGSEDTARRPPSVKAALSVSFGQRAPHRASTRDSSPVRRAMAPSYDRNGSEDSRRSPSRHRGQSRELSDREHADRGGSVGRGHDRDKDRYRDRESSRDMRSRSRDRESDYDRDRDRDRRNDYDRRSRSRDRERDYDWDRDRDRRHDYDRRSRYSNRERSSRDRESSVHREIRSRRSRSRSRSPPARNDRNDDHSSGKDKAAAASNNLAKLKDLYGDLSDKKGDASGEGGFRRDHGAEEVIRLGGSSWK
ncbi:Pre-mRNA splicing factor SR-like 1-like protein [Drosera capensis]